MLSPVSELGKSWLRPDSQERYLRLEEPSEIVCTRHDVSTLRTTPRARALSHQQQGFAAARRGGLASFGHARAGLRKSSASSAFE